MTRDDLKKLSQLRIKEARALYDNKCYNGAIYIGGYAIELSLKARICKILEVADFPDSIQGFKTHDISRLLMLSGLTKKFERKKSNTSFGTNWDLLTFWNDKLRYGLVFKENRLPNKTDAIDFLNAIDDQINGVYTWIKKHW